MHKTDNQNPEEDNSNNKSTDSKVFEGNNEAN